MNSHEVQKERSDIVRESIGFLTSDIKLDEQFDVTTCSDSSEGCTIYRKTGWKSVRKNCFPILELGFRP